MEKRHFKDSGDAISLLGFGCMRLPTVGGDDAKIDVPLARRMVDHAYDHGVNYFDTAHNYHGGQSELFIGEALAERPRDSFHLATKMPPWNVKEAGDDDRVFERQLEKCRVDHFDFYLLHSMNGRSFARLADLGVVDRLHRRKEKGQIRRLGFSFHGQPGDLAKILIAYPWDFAQLQVNYLDWDMQAAGEQYGQCVDAGVPVAVMEPLRGGTLARLTEQAAAVLREADPTSNPAAWALRFAGSLPGVFSVLSGMSDFEQTRENVETMAHFRALDDGERAALSRAEQIYRRTLAVPCTACRYCTPCPSGVKIPEVFTIYNQYREGDARWHFDQGYHILGKAHNAEACTRCGVCAPKCPQGIAIPDRLAEVAAEAAH